jgi:hypothetical protein
MSTARARGQSVADAVPGLRSLWAATTGDPRIVVGLLDGPADLGHRALDGARIRIVESAGMHRASPRAVEHGTLVASLIFGRHGSTVEGVAPGCRGVIVPIYGGGLSRCTTLDLARAIDRLVSEGVHVINISGGQWTPSGNAGPHLEAAVRRAAERGVLIVAAAGNDGCACLHVPAALPGVLAVGAMDRHGQPLATSNWGLTYRRNGLLAPGEGLLGAVPAGGTLAASGTSAATAVVSGIAALCLSVDLLQGRSPDAGRIRGILLDSADPCLEDHFTCQRQLAGRLNLVGAVARLSSRSRTIRMSQDIAAEALPVDQPGADGPAPGPRSEPGVAPSAGCGCAACQAREAPPQLVFALGQLGYDLVSEARRDSLSQHMGGANPADPAALLKHLEAHPYEAEAVLWTLNLDQTPIYALRPAGPFAAPAYEMLRKALGEQLGGTVERVSVPGRLTGGQARLLNGMMVPVVQPELRGFYSWNTSALVEAVCGKPRAGARPEADEQRRAVRGFLERVYYELRSLGATPQERAINYAATNAFQIQHVYQESLKDQMELDSIEVERSPICRPESDCWDVKLHFFYPQRQVQTVRRVYRFTVDVSDIVPVMVGPVRSWFVR